MAIEKELLDQLLEGRDPETVFTQDGLLDELKKGLSERVLNAELDAHLDAETADGKTNRHNGPSQKTVLTGTSKVTLDIPRDRAGTFDPQLISPPTTLDEVRPLQMRAVVHSTPEGRLWNEFVARYHYLGYKTLVGAQMRYAVHDRNGWPLAMLGFSTAAWKLAPRDNFIGWTAEKREKNLPLVVDNPRFLILPWIEIPNLGSHILALVRRRLPGDWSERYSTTPVLIETFVEIPRYTGAVYRASGWTRVGTTQGRGRYDRHTKRAQPKKDIWLRPLRKDWRRTLNR